MNIGVLTGVRVTHQTASISDIEYVCRRSEREIVTDLLEEPAVREAFALQTCNRAEAYVITPDQPSGHLALSPVVDGIKSDTVEWMSHEESLRHLLRVASGLESLVLGEDQILGQVRSAYELAREAGGIGYVLDDALLKAIHVGERARTETAINEGIVSIGSAAAAFAARERPLERTTAVVIGAGEIATLSAKALARNGLAELIVANRTIPHAEHIADLVEISARAVGLDDLERAVDAADIIISATSAPEPVMTGDVLRAVDDGIVLDLAQPRDVDPDAATAIGITRYDLDDLRSITERTHERRRDAAAAVEQMIDREFATLIEQFKRKQADEAISAMYESAERIKRRELETALSKLNVHGAVTSAQRETIEQLADALTNQLLAAPTKSLRHAAAEDDWSTINTALQLFEPEFDDETVERIRRSIGSELRNTSSTGVRSSADE